MTLLSDGGGDTSRTWLFFCGGRGGAKVQKWRGVRENGACSTDTTHSQKLERWKGEELLLAMKEGRSMLTGAVGEGI